MLKSLFRQLSLCWHYQVVRQNLFLQQMRCVQSLSIFLWLVLSLLYNTFFRCKSAVLGLYAEANLLVGGCFDKKVYFFDPRQESPVKVKRWHRQPVLCVTGDDRYIVAGSEDKSISVYDRRAEAVFKSVHVGKPFCYFYISVFFIMMKRKLQKPNPTAYIHETK